MSKIKSGIDGNGAQYVHFHCPGCNDTHTVTVGGTVAPGATTWGFNNDAEKPTFAPSVLVLSGHYAQECGSCWCIYNKEHPEEPAPFKCYRCHSFVRDGRIQFLGDCTHELAGQTVDLPEWGHHANN